MKRKLISFDVFKKIEGQSLTNAERELAEAQDLLAEVLGLEFLELYTFGESDVTYETPDGTYIHATYTIKDDNIILENIEQLVVDEEGEKNSSRELVAKMVDSIVEGKELEATQKFEQYINSSYVKRSLTEAAWTFTASKPTGKRSKLAHKRRNRSAVAKGVRSRLRTLRSLSPSQKKQNALRSARLKKKLGSTTNKRARVYARKVKKQLKEWSTLCENVLGYIDYKEFGPVAKETLVRKDENGGISSVAMPTLQKRNEGKILSFNWKTLDTDVKVLRGKMKDLKEDANFARAMADLKRYNNVSDNQSLEETLEAIVARWPDLVYVTEAELSSQISQALEVANVKNFDDQTCSFMAEAILRTAHHVYTDKVQKIADLAGTTEDITSECKECEDAYASFKQVAESLYANLDESESTDLRVFADLLKALREVHELATETQEQEIVQDVEDLMGQCISVLNKEIQPEDALAEEVAEYINSLVESNVDGSSQDWDVVTSPHHTVVGDHPVLSKNAKVDGAPSNHPGDWKSPAPVSDGKSYDGSLDDEMQNNGWGNISTGSTYPELDNPYILKSGDFKMREKSVVDDNDLLAQDQSDDTWPNLSNPYSPKAANPKDVE
jgi:hypothetical protein